MDNNTNMENLLSLSGLDDITRQLLMSEKPKPCYHPLALRKMDIENDDIISRELFESSDLESQATDIKTAYDTSTTAFFATNKIYSPPDKARQSKKKPNIDVYDMDID